MTNETVVEIKGLTKSYGSVVALKELSLQVRRGEILALVGPNGAGKTTALKLFGGLLTPTSGCVSIVGFDVHRRPIDVKRRLAYIPDQPFLYEQLSVSETLAFIGGMYKMDPKILISRADELLAIFNLKDHLNNRVGHMSFGMKSRLVILLGLLHEPEVLIMDEPFFGLDPQTLRLTKQLLLSRASKGMTIILSTHQLSVVEDIAHRIAIIDYGKLLALDTLAALRSSHGGVRLEELFFQLTHA